MNPTEKLAALKAELAQLDAQLAQVDKWKERRRQLVGHWGSKGEIYFAEKAIRDEAFPIFEKCDWNQKRIIAVDDKWIILRADNRDDVTRYHRDTGRQEKKRTDWNNIDAPKALQIWNEWKAKQTTP